MDDRLIKKVHTYILSKCKIIYSTWLQSYIKIKVIIYALKKDVILHKLPYKERTREYIMFYALCGYDGIRLLANKSPIVNYLIGASEWQIRHKSRSVW